MTISITGKWTVSTIIILMLLTNLACDKLIAPTTTIDLDGRQCTGIAVSNSNRVFVCFPRWSDRHDISLAEISPEGVVSAYPNDKWNAWSPHSDPRESFVSVQSVWSNPTDPSGALWVLDTGNPKFEGVLPNSAKLVQIDLKTNRVARTIRFDSEAVPASSYLNDVRVDEKRGFAYITDSALGALLIVDLNTNRMRRVLEDHPSTKSQSDFEILISGTPLLDAAGKTPQIHIDGIALSPAADFLYYKPLTGKKLYRIAAIKLRNFSLADRYITAAVEPLEDTFPSDGMVMDMDGNLYLTSITNNEIIRRTPTGKLSAVKSNIIPSWPDSMAISPEGDLYFTVSQIDLTPRFNKGTDMRTESYKIFKLPRTAPAGK